MICTKCRLKNDYATANQADGTYLCFDCRGPAAEAPVSTSPKTAALAKGADSISLPWLDARNAGSRLFRPTTMNAGDVFTIDVTNLPKYRFDAKLTSLQNGVFDRLTVRAIINELLQFA